MSRGRDGGGTGLQEQGLPEGSVPVSFLARVWSDAQGCRARRTGAAGRGSGRLKDIDPWGFEDPSELSLFLCPQLRFASEEDLLCRVFLLNLNSLVSSP